MKNKRIIFGVTAKETAEKNNLVFKDESKDERSIFDFSLLDNIKISEREKEYIKSHDMYKVREHIKTTLCMYNTRLNDFLSCNGSTFYYAQKVYCKSTGKIYKIYTLVKIEHHTQKRIDYESRYTETVYKAIREDMCKCTEPQEEYKIS